MLKQKRQALISRLLLLLVLLGWHAGAWAYISVISNTTWSPTSPPPSLTTDIVVSNNATLTITGLTAQFSASIYITDGAKMDVTNGANINFYQVFYRSNKLNKLDNATMYVGGGVKLDADYYSTFLVTNGGRLVCNTMDIYQTNTVKIEKSSTVEMSETIVVYSQYHGNTTAMPGGKLVVDNSRITNNSYYSYLWGGISVIGGKAGTANNPSNYPHQRQSAGTTGKAIFNNATIENSRWGIVNWNRGATTNWPADWNGDHSAGGIIQATNTTFKNNGRALGGAFPTIWLEHNDNSVTFGNYTNTNAAGKPINDMSFLRGCTFETETVSGRNYRHHVKMHTAHAIPIHGCSFKDEGELAGPAVIGYNSSFTIDDHYNVHTTFDGMRWAVGAFGGGVTPVQVLNARFTNIWECGIAINSCWQPKLMNNSIELEDRNVSNVSQLKGIALAACNSLYGRRK